MTKNYARGPRHYLWSGDDVGYAAAHGRLARALGPAAERSCVGCSRTAQNWAYNHRDPNAKIAPEGRAYSPDPTFYQPMCIPCHRALDAAHRPCGTDAGYYRHRKSGQVPCDACKRGHREATYARKRRELADITPFATEEPA